MRVLKKLFSLDQLQNYFRIFFRLCSFLNFYFSSSSQLFTAENGSFVSWLNIWTEFAAFQREKWAIGCAWSNMRAITINRQWTSVILVRLQQDFYLQKLFIIQIFHIFSLKDGSWDWGLFQINDKWVASEIIFGVCVILWVIRLIIFSYWCHDGHRSGKSNGCGMDCKGKFIKVSTFKNL